MVEDALKSARALHRLIMTVSLVTIVFSLSLDLPREKVAQKAAIDALLAVDFLAYDGFVKEKVSAFTLKKLKPIGDQVAKNLAGQGHLIFGLDDIGDALAKPLHVGRFLPDDTHLSNLTDGTLVALDALNAFDLTKDIQVLVPKTDGLLNELNAFLRQHPRAGLGVRDIQAGVNLDPSPSVTSFLPGSEFLAGLTFELRAAVFSGGAPVFNVTFPADIQVVPGTSFLHWVGNQPALSDAVAIKDGQLIFAPNLKDAPAGFREEKLGPLSLKLGAEISKAGPENQSASILGATVPGILIVFASPLVLLVLSYYFMNHTGHLLRLSRGNEDDFRSFAWLPLALRSDWVGNIPAWSAELTTSAILLPVGALAVLYLQLAQFGDLGSGSAAIIVISALGILAAGTVSLRQIGGARRIMLSDSIDRKE